MKLSTQTILLPIAAVSAILACLSVYADEGRHPASRANRATREAAAPAAHVTCGIYGGVMEADGTERPVNQATLAERACGVSNPPGTPMFMDVPPIASLSSPPASGECSLLSSPHVSGKSAWQRGYDQAMSGRRFLHALTYGGGSAAIQPALAACREYGDQAPAARACCMAGFKSGHTDIQTVILGYLNHSPNTPQSSEARACFSDFDTGRRAGVNKCNTLQTACAHAFEAHTAKHVGCMALGYIQALRECPALQSLRAGLDRALENGALATNQAASPLEAPAASTSDPATAGSANPAQPPAPGDAI